MIKEVIFSLITVCTTLYTNNLKNRFLTASALSQNFCTHSSLAPGQWSLAPYNNFEEPPGQIPDSSDCLCISAAPQAIVFDFGGVMTIESNREAVVHFLCTSFNLSAEGFEQVNQEKRKAVKAGKTDAEFWLQYAKDRKVCLPKDWVHSFNAVMKDAIGVNPEMYELVGQLKEKDIPIALLSNIDDRLARLIRDFGLYEPFDPCLLSCEIGLEKPDPKIYDVLLKKMNLPAKEIVFVDDRLDNIEAAQKLGFDAILFTSQEQLQKELAKRGLL